MTFTPATLPDSDARLHGWVIAGAALVLAGIVAGVTWPLRVALHDQILRREAAAMAAVVDIQRDAGVEELVELGFEPEVIDVFYALLESPRLEGVVAMQMFESTGELALAVPDSAFVDELPAVEQVDHPLAIFHPDQKTPVGLGWGFESITGPWLEVVVPLPAGTSERAWVRYWLDGATVATELAEVDRRLWWQAGVSALGGALMLWLGLGWAFAKLRQRSADLAKANQELLLNSKTAAIGAISAHLMHGLNNPLAGLEGFIADESQEHDRNEPAGAAWAEAAETTKRVRRLVNEVLAVLQDEASGTTHYLTVIEVLDAVVMRAEQNGAAAGVVQADSNQISPELVLAGRVGAMAGLVMGNLVENAVMAIGRDGRVSLAATRLDADRVCIEIQDTGPGLPENVQRAAFSPVASSKPGGAGIGLALSAALAKHAGGELRLLATSAKGTRFGLELPISTLAHLKDE
ncbi:MAG: hypothetical protein SynsKO_39580 [Synoicihabitans sp.]